MIDKEEIFKNEIELISDKDLKLFAKYCIKEVPNYFFKIPASSTGKYHPTYTLGKGGLVRHTKAAVKIADSFLNIDCIKKSLTDFETSRNIIIFSLIFHDCFKTNNTNHTVFEHPVLAANFIHECYTKYDKSLIKGSRSLFEYEINSIASSIRSHMGEYNINNDLKADIKSLPLPITFEQRIVHICDYFASRKFINVEV